MPTSGPVDPASDDSTPWGWILAGVALLGALVALAVAMIRRRDARLRSGTAWRTQTSAVVDSARLLSGLLVAGRLDATPAERQQQAGEVEQTATTLERLAVEAPDDAAGGLARTAAQQLRGLVFAIEAEEMLRGGSVPPSSAQLEAADTDRRTRSEQLERTLGALEQA